MEEVYEYLKERSLQSANKVREINKRKCTGFIKIPGNLSFR